MVGLSTVLVTWAVTTVCFALVYFLGEACRAGVETKLSLALWYGVTLVAYLVSWVAVAQGKDELAAVLLRMTPAIDFLFVVVGRAYHTRIGENVLFIAMVGIIFGIPIGRAWETGDISDTLPQSGALLERMVALFAIASVAYGIWRMKETRRSRSDSDK